MAQMHLDTYFNVVGPNKVLLREARLTVSAERPTVDVYSRQRNGTPSGRTQRCDSRKEPLADCAGSLAFHGNLMRCPGAPIEYPHKSTNV